MLTPGNVRPPPASELPREVSVREGTVIVFAEHPGSGQLMWRGIVNAEIRTSSLERTVVREKEREYREKFAHPYAAAGRGYVDAVIAPSATRRHLIRSLWLLDSKVLSNPRKKHGNIPL